MCIDVTVKIFTLSEDQLQEEGGEGVSEGTIEDGDSDLTMSRLLDALLVCVQYCVCIVTHGDIRL